jgi:WD40 repeat protein
LEEVTLRVEGVEDKQPYPGLASFTAADAEYFFGREAEVEAVWKKLQRANMLAIVGASGAGKTSFVQAGLLPSKTESWRHVVCHPGTAPFLSLGQALVPEMSGDTEAIRQLFQMENPDLAVAAFTRWRQRHEQVLLILDQFEELFTLNPPEVQSRFAALMGRLARDADVHVLLCMRDDFFLRCHEHETLAPIFSELTPLGPPAGAALRRALVQPALLCGYRFEDERLVDEMLDDVQDERGTLPLLAFTMSRLWELRDREAGLLRRDTYVSLGGVGGALARHAEATLERIGADRQPIVHEIFRALVTAEGTRVARDMEELLSLFDARGPSSEPAAGSTQDSERDADGASSGDTRRDMGRDAAREALQKLIDARLLTSFDVPGKDGTAHRQRVEIIHESLLTSWPRLVRWRTQDADNAQLRDQLRQAAELWEERRRSEDMLWTGTAYREFEVWRERYRGGLTATEDAFARAMANKAERQRRRRRRLATSGVALLVGVLAVIGTLWQRSVRDAQSAKASHLYSLAQRELEKYPSVTLAYAIESLELADNPQVRRLVMEALHRAPTALVLSSNAAAGAAGGSADFSPDGRSVAVGHWNGTVSVWPQEGGEPLLLTNPDLPGGTVDGHGYAFFGKDSDVLTGLWYAFDKRMLFWSVPEGKQIATLHFDRFTLTNLSHDRTQMITGTKVAEGGEEVLLQVWSLDGAEPRRVGRRVVDGLGNFSGDTLSPGSIDSTATWLIYGRRTNVEILPLADLETAEPRQVGHHDALILGVAFHPDGERFASVDKFNEIRVWSLSLGADRPSRVMQAGGSIYGPLRFDREGTQLTAPSADGRIEVWDLEGPPEAEPLELRWNNAQLMGLAFHPRGHWIVTPSTASTTFWPLARRYPSILRTSRIVDGLTFGPDGDWIASASWDGTVRIWDLSKNASQHAGTVYTTEQAVFGVHADPEGRFLFANSAGRSVKISLDGEPAVEFPSPQLTAPSRAAIGPRGRYAAVGYRFSEDKTSHVTHVYDLETGETQVLDAKDGAPIAQVQFTPTGQVLVASGGKLRRWDIEAGTHEVLLEQVWRFDLSPDGRSLLAVWNRRASVHDLERGTSRELSSHGDRVSHVAFDATGTFVITGDRTGAVRVGPVTGEEPHLLVGHKGKILALAVDPKGRWIATAAEEEETAIHLWPFPEGEPLHVLQRAELLARLRTLTNLRVVPNEDNPSGYGLEIGAFPGWETAPTW